MRWASVRVRKASSFLSATVKFRSGFAILPDIPSDCFLKGASLSTRTPFILLLIRQAPYIFTQS